MDAIVVAIIGATAVIVAAVIAARLGNKKQLTEISVNTDGNLSEARREVAELRDTVTRLVEALAVAQESPAQERRPIPVEVIDAVATPQPPAE